jgi:hypothetical protein
MKYDAVVFDEALNNLSRLQLSLFCQSLQDLLKPGGHLVGRVMCRSTKAGKYRTKTRLQAVQELRDLKATEHKDCAPLIICLLHSEQLAFSPKSWIIDCSRWNEELEGLRGQGISDEEFRLWTLGFGFKLLSPDLDSLISELREASLSPSNIAGVRGTYVHDSRWSDTAEFYRIINFQLDSNLGHRSAETSSIRSKELATQ